MNSEYRPPRTRKYGVLNEAEAAAQRIKNKADYKARGNRAGVQVSNSNKATEKALRLLPIALRENAIKLSTYAAGMIVRDEAVIMLQASSYRRGPDQGIYPGDSMETETFYKKSSKQQAKRMARKSMVKKIGIKPKQYDSGAVYLAMVGPRRPEGSAAWILEWGGVIELWGTGRYYRLKPRPFMQPAGNGTVRQQQAAYINRTKRLWRES